MNVLPEVRRPGSLAFVVMRSVVLSVALAFVNLPTLSHAQSASPGIHVEILDIKNSTGTVACALFDAPQGFPTEFLRHATRIMMMKIEDTKGSCDFLDIEPGTYALGVIHDENMNGKMDTNWVGVPEEGYGFSSGAKISMSAPSFEDASFSYDGKDLNLTISLTY